MQIEEPCRHFVPLAISVLDVHLSPSKQRANYQIALLSLSIDDFDTFLRLSKEGVPEVGNSARSSLHPKSNSQV